MKKALLLLPLCVCAVIVLKAQVNNTSYINASGEKVLQLTMTIPLDAKEAWKYFTVDSLLSLWIAPVAHIELKNGGTILTNYDKTKSLSDSSSIKLDILSYLENELLVLKVKLNAHFPLKTQEEDQHLQEIIQLVPVTPGKTRIISSMIGWGRGKEWDQTYDFFVKGNEWTYRELLKWMK